MALELQYHKDLREAGVDEAGRGCLAGPVVAAAVILPPDFFHPLLNDSKQMKESAREELRGVILERALAWGIGMVDPAGIDAMNILNASHEAMHRAIHAMQLAPDFLLIDGNRFRAHHVPHACMIQGDGRFMNIAAASVLAKTERDALMLGLHERYPVYGWDRNKGYPTPAHRRAIQQHGPCSEHRRSFQLYPDLTLF